MKTTRFLRIGLAAALVAGCDETPDLVMSPDGDVPSMAAAVAKARQLRAEGKVPAGKAVEVFVAPGRYHVSETVKIGPADSGIHFTGAGWETTVIDGGREIGPFAEGADGVWEASVPADVAFEQLWVNDRRATRARTPNEGLYFYMKEQDYERPQGTFYAFPGDAKALAGLSSEELRQVMVVYWQSWDMGYTAVKSVDAATGKIVTERHRGRPLFFWDKTCPRYVLENYRGALDAPGEWFFDKKASKLYYRPRPGETLGATRAYVPTVETILAVEGDVTKDAYVKDVTFRGIGFEFTRLDVGPFGIDNRQSAFNVQKSAVEAKGADGLWFCDCRVAHTGAHGVWLRGGTVRSGLEHSLVEDLGAGGVYFGDGTPHVKDHALNSAFLTLHDSIVRHGGRILNGAVGVWLGHVNDCEVVHNEIADFLYTGVSMGWTWGYAETTTRRNHVDFNHIHHIQQGRLSDGGGFYSLGNQEGSTVCNNWIHDVNGYRDNGSPAWGLYTDEGSAHLLLASNLVERCRSGAIHQHYGTENLYANNIFATFDEFGVWRSRSEDHVTIRVMNNVFWWTNPEAGTYTGGGANGPNDNLPADGNVYWCAGGPVKGDGFHRSTWEAWRKGGQDASGAISDPLFVDPANGDWTLRPESPALKAGFKPFDWRQAGVLKDDPDWVRKAAERTWDEFRDAAKAPAYCREQASVDFERFGVGVIRSTMGALAPLSDAQGRAGTLEIVDKDVAQGKKALKLVELPGLEKAWHPDVVLGCRLLDGTARFRFSVKGDKTCHAAIEARDYDSAPGFVTGAVMALRGERFMAGGRTLCEVPEGVWADVEVALNLSGPKRGEWTCTVRPRGREAKSATLKFADRRFARLTWIGFISYGPVGSSWCLDDIRLWKE